MNDKSGWFQRQVSVGNILSILMMLAAILFSWSRLESRVDSIQTIEGEHFDRILEQAQSNRNEIADLDDRVTLIEIELATLGEHITSIDLNVGRIYDTLANR